VTLFFEVNVRTGDGTAIDACAVPYTSPGLGAKLAPEDAIVLFMGFEEATVTFGRTCPVSKQC
jgi:hypothetical protein